MQKFKPRHSATAVKLAVEDVWICNKCGCVFGIYIKCPVCGTEKARPVEKRYMLRESG